METAEITARDFMHSVAVLLVAKMEQEGVTFDELAKRLRLTKNFVFRACQGGEDPRYHLGVSPSLMRLLNYIEIEPADLLGRAVRPGDLEVAIHHDPRIDPDERKRLLELVRVFYRESQGEQ